MNCKHDDTKLVSKAIVFRHNPDNSRVAVTLTCPYCLRRNARGYGHDEVQAAARAGYAYNRYLAE